jgi:hypothetical protein
MNIAILGWGSLIWCPGGLRIRTRWHPDGPQLPIEFARISQDDRLTLVIHPESPEQPTYWALSEFTALNDARNNLKRREKSKSSDIHYLLRDGTGGEGASEQTIRATAEWMALHPDVGAVVWTGLPSNWQEKRGRAFSAEDAIRFLSDLEGARDRAKAAYDRAREYLTNTPSAVDTPLRQAMRARGWRDVQLSSTLFELAVPARLTAPESPEEER